MNIGYIDDNREDGRQTISMIKSAFETKSLRIEKFDFFHDSDSFFKTWKPGTYDIIILDILLDQEFGVDIARQIRTTEQNAKIVFCSTSNEFATESYEVAADYYLTKPVTKASADTMVNRFLKDRALINDYVTLPGNEKLVLSQMIYSDYHNHCIMIKLKKGEELKVWLSQAAFLNLLAPFEYFLPVTNGTVINMKEVVSLTDDSFIMTDGSHVPFVKRRKKEIEGKYKNYLFLELRRQ